MSLYIYDGPVYGRDGRKIESRRIEYTNANSESEARRNMQYKIGKDKDIIYGNIRLHVTDHEELEPSIYCSANIGCPAEIFPNIGRTNNLSLTGVWLLSWDIK